MLSRAEYLASLPRKRVSAAAIIRDEAHRVLLVQPTYRDDWLLPGGSVESYESPARAAAREIREELGLDLEIGRALVMQCVQREDDPHGILHFAYDGGVLDSSGTRRIDLAREELRSFRFVPPAHVHELANAETTARALAAIDAVRDGGFVELGR